MSLEQKIEELAAALVENTDILKQLVAGQKAAIEVVKQGNPATATRGRKAKDTPATPNTSDAPADTASGAEDAGSASEGNSAGAEKTTATSAADTNETTSAGTSTSTAPAAAEKEKPTFSVAAKKWMEKEEKGTDAYKARGAKVVAILANFGAGKMSELKDEDEAKAMFFLKRTAKGLPVTFDAAYDFEGAADQPEPAAASDDGDDMFD